jgi:hypothetical protein
MTLRWERPVLRERLPAKMRSAVRRFSSGTSSFFRHHSAWLNELFKVRNDGRLEKHLLFRSRCLADQFVNE